MKTCLFVDNSSEAKLINESFACTNKPSIFKLKKCMVEELYKSLNGLIYFGLVICTASVKYFF